MATTLVEFVRPHLHGLEIQDPAAMQHVLELGALVWNVTTQGGRDVADELRQLTVDFSGKVSWGADTVARCVTQLHARKKTTQFRTDRRQFVAVVVSAADDGTLQLQVAGALPAEIA